MEGHPTNSDDMDLVVGLIDGALSAQIMTSAVKLEIFDKLSPGGQTVENIAKDNGWDQDCLERLMNGCVALKLLSKSKGSDGQYIYNNTGAGSYLIKNTSGTSMWSNVFDTLYFMQKMTGEAYKGVIKGPSPSAQVHGHHKEDLDKEGHHHHHHMPTVERDELTLGDRGWTIDSKDKDDMLHKYKSMGAPLEPMIDQLVSAFDLTGYKHVVDLGCGSGMISLAMKRKNPNLKVTMIEMPDVCEVLKSYFIPNSGFKDINVIAEDMFKVDLPKADLFILGRIAHHFSEKETEELFKKMFFRTNLGGGVMLFEKCLNETEDGPLTAITWDVMRMQMGMKNDKASDWAALLTKYGFSDIHTFITQPKCQTDIIFGKKVLFPEDEESEEEEME